MEMKSIKMEEKPECWPANAIECQLENIYNVLNKFKMNPNYRNREVLISLVTDYDLNQRSMLGMHRTTDYEVACINSLFLEASVLQLNALKTYIYELIGYKTRMQKMISWVPTCGAKLEIKEFEGLLIQLKLYYISYQKHTVENDKYFSQQLIEIIEEHLKYSEEHDTSDGFKKSVAIVTNAYISLLNDISYFRCVKRTKIWAFNRNEIYKLFKLAAKLIKLDGDSPSIRPLKGVLMTSISNYVLKSRNQYNEDYICKYISSEVAEKSIANHEIWMSIIENLNDEREQRVIPELLEDAEWLSLPWVEDIDFTPKRKYYVSSFSKSLNDSVMQKDYGSCIYGFKDDRMAEILSPILHWHLNEESKTPVFSQVIAFDVLYDREEAKEEAAFLCNIIDFFNMSDTEKKNFLEEILQYWILSVKDKKWEHERERRYVLFMYDDYKYIEINTSDSRFLKLKTSLFIQPDFILGDNPAKDYIKRMVDNKRKAISMKQYLFCEDCFSRDFDVVAGGVEKHDVCTICNSRNVSVQNP